MTIGSFECITTKTGFTEDPIGDYLETGPCVYGVSVTKKELCIHNSAWATNFYIDTRDRGLDERTYNTEFYAGKAVITKIDGSGILYTELEAIVKNVLGVGILISKDFAETVLVKALLAVVKDESAEKKKAEKDAAGAIS